MNGKKNIANQNVWRNKTFLAVMLAGILVSLFFLFKFYSELDVGFHKEKISGINVYLFLSAALFQLIGHYLRAWKSAYLIDPIKPAVSRYFLFEALSIGFLFNTILPFRLGEIIRAHIVGKKLFISRTVVFLTILFERAVDGIIIFIVSLFIYFFAKNYVGALNPVVFSLVFTIFILSCLIFCLIYILFFENKHFFSFIHRSSALLNENLKNKIRLIVWSAIYGTKVIAREANIVKYILVSLAMWFFYLASIYVLLLAVFGNFNFVPGLIVSITSFLSVSVPSGPAYIGTYHFYFSEIVGRLFANADYLLLFSVVSWFILIIPIFLLGILFLIFGESRKKRRVLNLFLPQLKLAGNSNGGYHSKLFRFEDISGEMSRFFDDYFKNLEIAHVVNTHEVSGKTKLLKTFKGGSNALTILIWNNKLGRECVRKITLPQNASKLEAQYDWISERQGLNSVPKVLGCEKDEVSYSLDLKYEKDFVPFFDYIHSSNLSSSKRIMDKVIDFVNQKIYLNGQDIYSRKDLDYYISTKIFDKVNDCLALNRYLVSVIDYPQLVINGKIYDNFSVIMDKITKNEKLMNILSRYWKTPLHGDLTIDNIMVNGEDFILLDPNDENYISDPIVDYGKLYQSLHSGYEFLILLEKSGLEGNQINFEENISSKYTELFKHLEQNLAKRLTSERFKLIKLHEAVHYFRMLTYKAKINPETFLVFYAIAIRLLNEFYAEYR